MTFLFTDIEGSTERWERDFASMQELVRLHDGVLRAVIAAQGGAVFKTIGDAFCAAFDNASAAAQAAVMAQRAFQSEEFSRTGGLRVRVALHSGHADERDGDYFGPAVNRVARLLSLAHGGQILLSSVTAAAVDGRLEPGLVLRDLGRHRLKDIAEPFEVWQLLADGIPGEFPPLRSQTPNPGNLPSETTTFIGRDGEMAEVVELVQAHRLVTLTGPGGIGKTRLAVHAAHRLLPFFDDGVWLVELASISDGRLVCERIAEALGAQLQGATPSLDALAARLGSKKTLLVLDNCEHIVSDAAAAAEALLRACANLKILATSRETLEISGERPYRTPPLGGSEAMALFAERAASADARFSVDDANRPIVHEICRRLDGIALAIELAAARLSVLSVRTLADKLDERFALLAGGSRTAMPRQRTLRALIDWSYDLLDERERTVFRRLGVFAGGFPLELGGRVCADEPEFLAVIESLVKKSLLYVEDAGEQRRFELLESIREYALERLRECEEAEDAARRHAAACLELAEELNERVDATPDAQWTAIAKAELDNWRAALRWALERRRDLELGRRLAGALRIVWSRLGPREGRSTIEAAIAVVDEATPADVRAQLFLAQAHLALILMEYRVAANNAQRALETFGASDDSRRQAEAKFFAGSAYCLLGEGAKGEPLLHAALDVFRTLGWRRMIAATLQALGLARLSVGDPRAAALLREALDIYRETPGAARAASHIALNLAEVEFNAGNVESALVLAREAVDVDRVLDDRSNLVFALNNVAAYLCALRRTSEAVACAREAMEIGREAGIEMGAVWALQHLAAARTLDGSNGEATVQRQQAARLLGFVDQWIASRGIEREYTEQREYDDTRWTLSRALGGDEADELLREGTGWSLEGALAAARLL